MAASTTRPLLLVFDSSATAAALAASTRGCSDVVLFPLTSDDALVQDLAERLRAADSGVRVARTAELVEAETRVLREDVAAWAARLGLSKSGGKTVREALELPGLDVSAWWFGLFAERNTFKTDAYLRVAQLRAARRALSDYGCGAASVRVAPWALERGLASVFERAGVSQVGVRPGGPLRRAVMGRLETARWLAASVKKWLLAVARGARARHALRGTPSRRPGPGDAVFVSYFPSLDPVALERGVFRNRYTGPLQDLLRSRERRAAWLFIHGAVAGQGYGESLALARTFASSGESVFMVEEFLTLPGALSALGQWAAISWRGLRLFDALDRDVLLSEPMTPGALEVLRGLWRRSVAGPQLMEAVLFTLMFREALAGLPGPADWVYLLELQPWEMGLCAARRALRPDVRLIGALNGSLLGNFFSYWRCPQETAGGGPWPMPVPDIVAANGERPARVLSEGGLTGVVRVEALRNMGLAAMMSRPALPPGEPAVLVAGSADIPETRNLARLVHRAFPRRPGARILLKSHSLSPFEDAFAALGIDPQACGYELVGGSASEVLSSASLVLTGGSGIAIEALAAGRPVIVPSFPDLMQMSPLSDSPGCFWRAGSPEELRAAVSRALAGERPCSIEAGREFVRAQWDVDPALPGWRRLLGL